MPYIKKDIRREQLQQGSSAQSAGELNYQIFFYLKHQAFDGLKSERVHYVITSFVREFLGIAPNYQRYNDAVGVLILCGKELVRRLSPIPERFYMQELLLAILDGHDDEIAIYEDIKIRENSDVE